MSETKLPPAPAPSPPLPSPLPAPESTHSGPGDEGDDTETVAGLEQLACSAAPPPDLGFRVQGLGFRV